ncbi:hypothetical protein U2I83_18615 [Bacillus amyloliquefaciens]|uniref:hypothetical protein n=1 Tax=Bacillus amyloliquefaciens TaxID=1390 RepID=UPI0032DF1012
MAKERKPVLNLRTTQMSDEMYDFIMKQSTKEGGFREYAFKLIEKDMQEQKETLLNKEKDRHVYDELHSLKEMVLEEFRDLRKKLSQKTFYSEPPEKKTASDTIEEGQLITEKITGTIDEEYDHDF